MKTLLEYFIAKVGRGEILNPGTGNESLREISNDNGVTVVNFATSKNSFINIPELLLLEKHTTKLIIS
jgi:hypothetical protein